MTKGKPRLCEVQVINGYDVRGFYLGEDERRDEAIASLTVPADNYHGGEEFGGGWGSARELRYKDLEDLPPTTIDGVRAWNTKELAVALKGAQPLVVIDVASVAEVIPGAKSLLLGGLAFQDPKRDAAYETAFSGLLTLLVPDLSREIVFCSSKRDWQSANAAIRARKLGYVRVGWYRGGMQSWKAAGLPVVNAVIRAMPQKLP